MKIIIRIVLSFFMTAIVLALIFGLLHLATGREFSPRGGGWLAVPLLCWLASGTVIDRVELLRRKIPKGIVQTRDYGLAETVSQHADSVRVDIVLQAENIDCRREEFIRGAKDAMVLAGNPLPSVSALQKKMFVELYGSDWFRTSSELLSACLVFLDEYRFVSDFRLQQAGVFQEGAREHCLLNAINCALLAGANSVPTVSGNRPNFLAFALALGVDDPGGAMFSEESNTQLLLYAARLRGDISS